MAMWKSQHDPHISVHPVSSTAFLPIVFKPPGFSRSIHVAVYLPTLGQESKFLEELSKLSNLVDELSEAHPEAPIYLRGDFNVNHNNKKRNDLLNHFCSEHHLFQAFISKPTYHHFVGAGQSDSYLDRILFSGSVRHQEVIKSIECKLTNPLVDSHHDVLISEWLLSKEEDVDTSFENIVAPIAENDRQKVLWSDTGIQEYQNLVLPHLTRIQNLWLSSPSKTSISLLLESTTNILTSCAALTNRTIPLDKTSSPKPVSTPRPIRVSKNHLLKQNRKLLHALSNYNNDDTMNIAAMKEAYNKSRNKHRKLVREYKAIGSIKRDENLHSILSRDPSSVFKSVKHSKRSKAGKIYKLTVGHKTYVGDSVKDGFYDSISQLKTRDWDSLDASQHFKDLSRDYQNILEVCRNGTRVPAISENDSLKLLQKMKPGVSDFYGVSPNHYNFAGPAGWKHFNLLLNSLLNDVNNTSIKEINVVYACILFKGHGKVKTSDRSYRTISTCPVVAKALDLYIRDLNINSWNDNQAETQFQGEGAHMSLQQFFSLKQSSILCTH